MVLSVMIITCPSCATRYSLDDSKIPDGGRQVRCVQCSHIWHQEPSEPDDLLTLGEVEAGTPEAEVPQLEDDPDADTPSESPPGAEEPQSEEPAADELDSGDLSETEIVDAPIEAADVEPDQAVDEAAQDDLVADHLVENEPVESEPPLASAGGSTWRSVRERVVEEDEEPKRSNAAGWAVLAVLVVSVIAAIFFFRTELEEIWPPSQRFYSTIDGWLGEKAPKEKSSKARQTAPSNAYQNVSINIESSRIAVVNGERVLLIEGLITNSGDTVATIPNLRGSLRGEKGETLYTWNFSVPFLTIDAGAQQTFETRVVDPPAGAKSMNLDPVTEN